MEDNENMNGRCNVIEKNNILQGLYDLYCHL